ncbi:hypothetical protein EAN55_11505 [Escherichia albertii]|nr:hypothetical protein [Escherichia albertii]
MLIPLLPVMTAGEAKTNLFPWFMYPPVETFVARMLAKAACRTATFFLLLTSPYEVLCLHVPLLADNHAVTCTMPLVCKSLIYLLVHNSTLRYFSQIFRD